MSFLAIEWNPSIGIDLGFFVIRWYSLMFVIAFLLGLRIMKKIYITDNIPVEKVFPTILISLMFVSSIVYFINPTVL